MSYTCTETPTRIVFVDEQTGQEICGAFMPQGHDYWCLYITRTVTALTGLQTPPHREHFHKDHGRRTAKAWAEVIAALYALATREKTAA